MKRLLALAAAALVPIYLFVIRGQTSLAFVLEQQ